MHSTYTHTYILNIFPNKNLFVCHYECRNASPSRTNSKRGRDSDLRGVRAWLTPDWFQFMVYSVIQEQLVKPHQFNPQMVLNSAATTEECVCRRNTSTADTLFFLLHHFYYALSHFKTSLYWLHITCYLHIKVNVSIDLGPNPFHMGFKWTLASV